MNKQRSSLWSFHFPLFEYKPFQEFHKSLQALRCYLVWHDARPRVQAK